jgi:hypothetical protein
VLVVKLVIVLRKCAEVLTLFLLLLMCLAHTKQLQLILEENEEAIKKAVEEVQV